MNHCSKLFFLWIVQGLAAFFWLASLPVSAEHRVFLGYSASRLALMGFTLVLISVLTWLYLHVKIGSLLEGLQKPLYRIAVLITLAAPMVILILRALGKTSSYTYTAYAERLAPLAAWFALSALELALFIAVDNQRGQSVQPWTRQFFRYTLYAILVLAALIIFVAVSGVGITRYNDGSWGVPTTPFLEWQIILALASGLAFITAQTRWRWLRKDHFTFALIYVLTCLTWLSQPVNPGYFATPPRAPNFEIFPFSDALIYAQYAQSALVGNGFMWPDVPTRPLYITFITWLHAIGGNDYNQVIVLQTLVLAAFPAVLYLLGKELAGRPLGFGMALLAIFRDLTANVAAPFALNYTYTKLLFSEIPAALLISLFAWMAIRWMRQPKPAWYPLLAGGLLGASALIRLQSVVVLAAIIPIGFFTIRNRKRWLADCLLMGLGLSLALIPWLARNYSATGGLVLDNPISQSMVLARRWSGNSGNDLYPHLSGEGDAQYTSRMTGMALKSLRTEPGRIMGSALNHFFNNEIANLLVFPLRDQLDSPAELLWPSRAFWQTWDGKPTPGQIPILGFYLLLLGAGIAAAVQKNGLAGLLPLGLSIVYNAWTALFFSSGDRFLVPVDWAIYLYLFLGLLTLSRLIFMCENSRENCSPPGDETAQNTQRGKVKTWIGTSCIIIFVLVCGASITLTENAFPRLYEPVNVKGISNTVEVTLHGRAVYPRWYAAGDGEPGSAKLGYGKEDRARLVFFMTGEINSLVILPLAQAPDFFPNISNVTVRGRLQEGHLLANSIQINKDGISASYQP